jgi:acyl carrier protein
VQELKAQLRQFIEDTFLMGTRSEPLADDASFLEHHVLDSTGFLELIAFLEETYAIKVDDHEMVPENLDSLDSLVGFVGRKRAA